MGELSFYQFLIVCPLIFISCFVDAVAGGGGLISLPAYMIAGLPTHEAIATNKLSASMGAACAVVKYFRLDMVPWKNALFCLPFAIGGGTVGANIALFIPENIFKYIMLVLLPLTAAFVMRKNSLVKERAPYQGFIMYILSAAIAFVVGMYDGFYGPGTGVFLILLLLTAAHYTLDDANGTAKSINFVTNVSSLVIYLINGKVVVPLGLAAGIFGMAGGYLGAKAYGNNGAKIAKPIILAVLAIFFIKIIIELLQA